MGKIVKYLALAVLAILMIGVAFLIHRIYKHNYNIWLADYTFNSPSLDESSIDGVIDIIYIAVDHWEPGGNVASVNRWANDYRVLADKHLDSDGIKVQHTFYYPIESFRGYEVDSLVSLCGDGYGDVEVHLHHKNDTSESLRKLFTNGIDSLQAHGALINPSGKTYFSFVHGNWALDNSRDENGVNYCGVNNELTILMDLGCYCDCTFPALQDMAQPSLVNKIYYATDDPEKPKSYNTGVRCEVGVTPQPNQLLIFEGPQMINWSDWRFKTHPTIDDGDIYDDMLPDSARFNIWVKAHVHVKGRPNWVFVRTLTHGAATKYRALDANLGEAMDDMLTAVESKYENNERYRLHYMTMREAYNVIKAAEAGNDGNPNDFRDYILEPYIYGEANQTQERP